MATSKAALEREIKRFQHLNEDLKDEMYSFMRGVSTQLKLPPTSPKETILAEVGRLNNLLDGERNRSDSLEASYRGQILALRNELARVWYLIRAITKDSTLVGPGAYKEISNHSRSDSDGPESDTSMNSSPFPKAEF